MKRSIFALAFAAGLCGCTSTGTNVPPQQLAQFLDGKSTKTEIIAKLGPPQSAVVSARGETILTYVHAASAETRVTLIPALSLVARGGTTKSHAVSFVVDQTGTLHHHVTTNQASASIGGF